MVTPIQNPNQNPPNPIPSLIRPQVNRNRKRNPTLIPPQTLITAPYNPQQPAFYPQQPFPQLFYLQQQAFYLRPLYPAPQPQNFHSNPNFFTLNLYPTLPQPLVVKLTDNNFLLWKNQLLNVVLANGLSGFLDGSIPAPPKFLDLNNTQSNPNYLGWERYNCFIMCWFYSSLFEEKIGEIVSLESTSEIWSSLTRSY